MKEKLTFGSAASKTASASTADPAYFGATLEMSQRAGKLQQIAIPTEHAVGLRLNRPVGRLHLRIG